MRVAVGFRAHTGWTSVVAAGRERGGVQVAYRGQLMLGSGELPAQVYHAARELDGAAAAELVRRAERDARDRADAGLAAVLAELRARGHDPVAAGIPVGAAAVPASLARILASHALLHAAEGDLYCQALAEAADRHGLAVSLVPARDLTGLACRLLGLDEPTLRRRLTDLGRALGPPWRRDEKDATLAAALALAAGSPASSGRP